MTTDEKHVHDLSEPLHSQLKLLARIALIVSAIAFLALLLTLLILFRDQVQESYFNILVSLTHSREQLGIAMWFGGAIIVFVAGFMSWLLLLYSSARIAGPLYRFYRNLEMEIDQGPVKIINLRRGDYLQDLSHHLSLAAENLQRHHQSIDRQVLGLQQLLDAEGAADRQQELRQGIHALRNITSSNQA